MTSTEPSRKVSTQSFTPMFSSSSEDTLYKNATFEWIDEPYFVVIGLVPDGVVFLLFSLGFIGNILTTVVLSMNKFQILGNATSVFIMVLAISDNVTLLLGTLYPTLPNYIENLYKSDIECKLINFLHFASLQISSWILAVISIERAISVSLPQKYKAIFTPKRAVVMSSIVVFAFACLNIPLLIGEISRSFTCDTEEFLVHYREAIAPILDFLFTFSIPFCIIFVCSIIIVTMLKVKVRGKHASKITSSVSVTMLFVNLIFIVTMLPFCVVQLMYPFPTAEMAVAWEAVYNLSQLNPVFNFFVYCLGNPRFRNGVKNLLIHCTPKLTGESPCAG